MTTLDFVSLAMSSYNYTLDEAIYEWYRTQIGWEEAQWYARTYNVA